MHDDCDVTNKVIGITKGYCIDCAKCRLRAKIIFTKPAVYAESCNEWKVAFPSLSALATQLQRYGVAEVASCWRLCPI